MAQWVFRIEAGEGPAGFVELGGYHVPASSSLYRETDNGAPDLAVRFEIRDGKPECVEFTVRSKPTGRGIRTADLRAHNVDALTTWAFARWAVGKPAADEPTGGDLMRPRVREVERARRGRPRAANRAELERVAEVYRAHIDGAPVKAVQDFCGYTPYTASRRVQQARAAGLLPPTTPGKRKA